MAERLKDALKNAPEPPKIEGKEEVTVDDLIKIAKFIKDQISPKPPSSPNENAESSPPLDNKDH